MQNKFAVAMSMLIVALLSFSFGIYVGKKKPSKYIYFPDEVWAIKKGDTLSVMQIGDTDKISFFNTNMNPKNPVRDLYNPDQERIAADSVFCAGIGYDEKTYPLQWDTGGIHVSVNGSKDTLSIIQ